jgi:hypothetical protein
MDYLLVNNISGRILSLAEYKGDGEQIVEVPDTDYILYYQANSTPDIIYKKYLDTETQTLVDKTEMSLAYSHPHQEKDFFSGIIFDGPQTVSRAPVESWDKDEVDLHAQYMIHNDYDEIVVPANTTITISNIPEDFDTMIYVNGALTPVTSSLNVNSAVNTVTIDSTKYFIKTIQIVEQNNGG